MSYTPALAQRLFPSRTLLREIVVQIAGVALVAGLAQISVELVPVPVTGQTLGVLLVGAALGFRRGSLCMVNYVALGALGLPVFAGFAGGPIALTGPTGGYLIGFILSAGTVGLFAEHGYLKTLPKALGIMTLATLPVFVIGLAWLMHFIPPADALWSGCVIFLPGAVLKIALAAAIVTGPARRWQD